MKILFFGDSVTESGRDLGDPADLGTGYVKIAAGKLRLLYPETPFQFVNKGVGGNKTADLLARTERDVVAEQPDIVVLECGINDVWHRFTCGEEVTAEEFRGNYRAIAEQIKATGAKLIAVEPYALNVGDKQRLRPCLNEFNLIVRETAAELADAFIPIDEIFAGVTQDIAPAKFAADGIHPTHRGCRYIADLLIKELKKFIS